MTSAPRLFAILATAFLFTVCSCTTGEFDATGELDDTGTEPGSDAADPVQDGSLGDGSPAQADTSPDATSAADASPDAGASPDADALLDADALPDTAPDAAALPGNVPAPCPASGPGSGPSKSWSNAFGGHSFSGAGEPFQAVQYCFSMDQTTAVSFQIDGGDEGGYFETHNGAGTIFGPVRWRAELSACRGEFTASETSPCAVDQNELRLEWVRGDLASVHPDRCVLEPGTTYYLNVRVVTPQPNTYCTNSSGIELDPEDIFCGGPDPVGVCPMIPAGDSGGL